MHFDVFFMKMEYSMMRQIWISKRHFNNRSKNKICLFRKWNYHHKCYGSLDIGCHCTKLGILVLLANFDFGNNNPVHVGNTKIEPHEVRIQYSSIGIIYDLYRILFTIIDSTNLCPFLILPIHI